ncbi:MAG TPA: ATP-binding protein [Azospirillaceae bacterium]|nr:ATP-binding protein [Azospirillaceae bacterium]
MFRLAWLGRIQTQAHIALAIFLGALIAQYGALVYALDRNHTLVHEIAVENQQATKAVDALSDDLAMLSYRILGVVGGIYAAPNIAHEIPKLGNRIITSWQHVRTGLTDYLDEDATPRADAAIAALPGFLERTQQVFAATHPEPTETERQRLEQHHDEWLDIRPALTLFTEEVRERVTRRAEASLREARNLGTRLSFLANATVAVGLLALGITWYLLIFVIARPVTHLVGAMRRIATGDTSAEIAGLDDASEVGDMARAVQVFREKSVENRRLQREEARRTAELARARDAAQAASRTKSEFLANMSHELRTPLNAILGFSEMMATQIFGPLGDPRYVDYAADIQSSGRHLLDIINDILDIAKVEAGQLKLRCEPVDLGAVIETCRRLVRERASTAEIGLLVAAGDGMPMLEADEVRLKQILLNLLSNAVKFTPRGGQVVLTVADGPDGSCELVVADTGIGMTEAEIAVALQPFRQIDGALSRRYEGTGLGLPLTKALVELHDGEMIISSAPGVGTTVTVRLPRHRIVSRTRLATGLAAAAREFEAVAALPIPPRQEQDT